MNAKEAVEYIHSAHWQLHKPGLYRIRELCSLIGDPQKGLKFIHVAGTNGKGSFSSMMNSVLMDAGYNVGLFTSPYILSFNERIRYNGENISDGDLACITEYVKAAVLKMQEPPTEFELICAIGLEYFKRKNCDIVVFECGLGGRYDSTNVIDASVLSVITGISLDHMAILGDSEDKIAYEKAGIIKNNVPVLWCGENSDADRVIRREAALLSSPVYTPLKNIEIKHENLQETVFDVDGYKDIKIHMLGNYQVYNARNVITACEILMDKGYKISLENIRNGLSDALWLARFEIIKKDPYVIFDGGHNIEGVGAAVDSIKRYFKYKKVCVLSGVMADKDHYAIASKISEIAYKVFTVRPDNVRSLDAKDYAKEYESMGVTAVACDDLKSALECAIIDAKDNDTCLLILGSLYMYGEVKAALL